MVQETYLITGAGTGFGKGIALGLAEQGKKVIAGVETMSEVSALIKEAKENNIEIQVEKLDVTDPADRERAWTWDIDVLLNNAGISEGGSLADIPEERLRNQFEVNVSGLMADPLSGPYGGSKFTLEAFAESLSKELQEFNVQVATINPGPYLTGFNDREFEAWRTWRDNPEERLFDYTQLAFPYEQFDPEGLIKEAIKVMTGETNDYRNVNPKAMESIVNKRQKELWNKKIDENLGERHEMVQKSIDIEPATTPTKGIVNKIKDKL